MMKLKERFNHIRQSKTFKRATAVFISMMIASMFCLACFATEGVDDMTQVQTALSSSFDTMSGNITSVVVQAIPPAVACTAIYVVVRKGISFFVGLAKKG